jgi:hypothetical protein
MKNKKLDWMEEYHNAKNMTILSKPRCLMQESEQRSSIFPSNIFAIPIPDVKHQLIIILITTRVPVAAAPK